MRRKLALYGMFGLFACAYATLGHLPRSAAELLRSPAEHVIRSSLTENALNARG